MQLLILLSFEIGMKLMDIEFYRSSFYFLKIDTMFVLSILLGPFHLYSFSKVTANSSEVTLPQLLIDSFLQVLPT